MFELLSPQESAISVREQTPPILATGPKRRSTRLAHAVPLIVTWTDSRGKAIAEETATASINCHGFQYFSRRRPPKSTPVVFQIIENTEDNNKDPASPERRGHVAWVRKSRRLDGFYLVGIELDVPLNIWNIDEVPDDWAVFSPLEVEEPVGFLADIDRILRAARTENYYKLLDVESNTPRTEVKRRFYQLARRFHPDHHRSSATRQRMRTIRMRTVRTLRWDPAALGGRQ